MILFCNFKLVDRQHFYWDAVVSWTWHPHGHDNPGHEWMLMPVCVHQKLWLYRMQARTIFKVGKEKQVLAIDHLLRSIYPPK